MVAIEGLILAVDVDGVLAPSGQPSKTEAGFRHVRTHPAGTRWANPHKPLKVWLHPDHGKLLLDLAGELDAALVWCTSWNGEANRWIGPEIGLPELPVLDVGAAGDHVNGVHWKAPAVRAWIGNRPLVWLDDDFGYGDHDWARARDAAGAPTLLVDIPPNLGVRDVDVAFVADWWREVSAT